MKALIEEKLNKGIDYDTYRTEVEKLVDAGKTSGPVQNEALAQHTKMGFQRMKKWEKITKISEETTNNLKSVKGNYSWLVIGEAWCGDVGQNIVALNKMAKEADIDLKMVFRDENLDLMDKFLTNGGRSIPKMLVVDNNSKEVVGEWGPRPKHIQNWFVEEKQKPGFDKNSTMEQVHLWYAKNKHEELQNEVVEMMQSIETK
jgi:hypothetical protein